MKVRRVKLFKNFCIPLKPSMQLTAQSQHLPVVIKSLCRSVHRSIFQLRRQYNLFSDHIEDDDPIRLREQKCRAHTPESNINKSELQPTHDPIKYDPIQFNKTAAINLRSAVIMSFSNTPRPDEKTQTQHLIWELNYFCILQHCGRYFSSTNTAYESTEVCKKASKGILPT